MRTLANKSLEGLRAEAERLNLKLPLTRDCSILREPLAIGGRVSPNRLCVQPMEGCDATHGGAPGELTLRRYRRFAEGGFGLIWLEATAVDIQGRSNPRQLWLRRGNVSDFAELVQNIRAAAQKCWNHEVVLILQLDHAGRHSAPEGVAAPVIAARDSILDQRHGIPADYPVISDHELDDLRQSFIEVSQLAATAGFDGVDLKSCHGSLLSELLRARRSGQYGGSLVNRAGFLRSVIAELRNSCLGIFPASRISLPGSAADQSERVALARTLAAAGARLLSVSAPVVFSEDAEREQPLLKFMRQVDHTRLVQKSVPEIPVVAGGFSWSRRFLPNVAAALLSEGGATLIGIGRAALANPDLAAQILADGVLDPNQCCIQCDACVQLIRDGGRAGCVVMDRAVYGDEYRRCRYFSLDNLRQEARRCRGCEPAPCRAGCPSQIDIPAFIKAFADDQMRTAYAILRESNVLPGMCARLCPVNMLCQGRCVATILDGASVPIRDIQFAVYRKALRSGWTGLRVPPKNSGGRVAVVGAGPAGVSCAVTLLERGHSVVLYERSSRVGGTPELAIPSTRFSGARQEMEAILKPALRAARLTIKHGVELGRDIALEELRSDYDAVVLAAGVWGEKSLGRARGVVPGLKFLSEVKAGNIKNVPERVVLLAGGDSAMDCAKALFEVGVRELLIVYAGSLSQMHWHMEDSWFRSEGVHFLSMTRPLGYCVDGGGKVTALKIKRGLRLNEQPALEETIQTALIIEALGLEIESSLKKSLSACAFTEEGLLKTETDSYGCGLPGLFAVGAVINGGDSVARCVAEGMRAGVEISQFLSQSGSETDS